MAIHRRSGWPNLSVPRHLKSTVVWLGLARFLYRLALKLDIGYKSKEQQRVQIEKNIQLLAVVASN
jgi:hypothetical protein